MFASSWQYVRACLSNMKSPKAQFDSVMFATDEQSMGEPRTPEWTCSEVLRLIHEYGNRPALWDPECEDYKNRVKKQRKWQELAEIFTCSRMEVERKMKILMSQYRRERLKVARLKKMGLTHRVTWYGYKAFAFMNKQWVWYRNRNSLMSSNALLYPVVKQESVDGNHDFNGSEVELKPFLNEDEDVGEHPEDNSSVVPNSYVSEMLSDEADKEVDNSLCENNEQNSLKDISKVSYDNHDEWSLFGKLVAHAFRRLPDDKIRCIVKHKINTILYEAELQCYNNVSALEK